MGERLPLERAADAHRRMETGATTGSVILIP
ncbi:zinc-binding dehydrogenase [Paraburkholderia acidicola]|uniref:Zinc-binding dehydrogenase n=1 Tax=Paraburkholderia acidicola TaxID=1912599 RepID=A0ABV1LVP8_9BURK